MGRTNEFTLVGAKATFAGKQGHAVKVGTTMTQKTANAVLATAEGAIDGIITDITITGATEVTLAVAKVGDIVLAKASGAITVGDELEVVAGGALKTKVSGVVVAKALESGVDGASIPVIIK